MLPFVLVLLKRQLVVREAMQSKGVHPMGGNVHLGELFLVDVRKGQVGRSIRQRKESNSCCRVNR